MRLPRAWFVPQDRDVLGLLRQQASSVDVAVHAVREWSVGQLPVEQAVEALREQAHGEREQRRALHLAVNDSFSTPLEPEDLFELAERLVEVLEESYALVREAQLLAVQPDGALRDMTEGLATASALVVKAVLLLPAPEAASVVDDVLDTLAAVEHGYREGMVALAGDRHARVPRMELYRRAEHIEVSLRRVARRIWYAVAKLG